MQLESERNGWKGKKRRKKKCWDQSKASAKQWREIEKINPMTTDARRNMWCWWWKECTLATTTTTAITTGITSTNSTAALLVVRWLLLLCFFIVFAANLHLNTHTHTYLQTYKHIQIACAVFFYLQCCVGFTIGSRVNNNNSWACYS